MRRALCGVLLAASCGSPGIDVSLRVATGQHPLEKADHVWLSLLDASGQPRYARDALPSDERVQLEGIQPGTGYRIALQATFAGDPIAAGQSCPFDLGATAPAVPLYFGLVGRFATASPPSVARTGAAAFTDGSSAIFAGGLGPDGAALATSELYDAVAGRFSPGPMLSTARAGARAVTLPGGAVLIIGGAASGATGIETVTHGKATPQATVFPGDWIEHAAVAFSDGSVLVTGGHPTGAAPSALAFHITLGGTSVDLVSGLQRARARHTMTLVGGGDGEAAVVAGGRDAAGPVDDLELYTPSGGFEPTGSLLTPRFDHTATLLGNGLVLIAGGTDAAGQPVAAAELVDPLQRISHPSGRLRTPRSQHTATLLPSGRVLITGGIGADGAPTASVEIFDPTLGSDGDFVAAQPLTAPRSGHAVLPLCDGSLLAAGGGDGADQYTPVP